MYFSVCICTRNRAESLRRTLENLSKQQVRSGVDWELLVVDNGSSDSTAAVIAEFDGRLPIRRAWQPEAGLSNARNCAVSQASGEYIIWTDDDVQPEPGWLDAYNDAFAAHPDAVLFGGPIVPLFEGAEAPKWFAAKSALYADALAVRDIGPIEQRLDANTDAIPYGANFAVRADAQRRFPYDPKLGVGPGMKRVGEETAVMRQLLEHDAGWWVPDAKVHHIIGADRQRLSYLSGYYFAQGETWAYTRLAHLPWWQRGPMLMRLRLARALHGHGAASPDDPDPSEVALRHLMKQCVYNGALNFLTHAA